MKLFRLFTIAVIATLLGPACAFIPSLNPTATPTATRVPPTATPTITLTPTATFTPTPFYKVETGRTVTMRNGGYRFARIEGYDISNNSTEASLISEDEKVRVSLIGMPLPTGLTVVGLIKQFDSFMDANNDDYTHSELVTDDIGGIPRITSEYTGFEDGQPMHGMISIYEPVGSKIVYLIVTAVGDQRWEREGRQVYDQLTNSLSIFPIKVWANCPITKSQSYGRSTSRPIRIGGGLVDGTYRTEEYLKALLGPNGEPVEYVRLGVEEASGSKLDQYLLILDYEFTTIYIDIYNYEELFVPTGFACSGPLPMAPFF